MGSRTQRREQEQYSVGKSAGFKWLLGRRNSKEDSAKLAALAFGAQDPGHADNGNDRNGWTGPSAAATAWVAAAVEMDNPGNEIVITPHKVALGMEAEEEEDPAQQFVKEDGFVIRQFKNGWYKGEMLRGCLEGHGHFAFANGESYEGEWVNNRMSGHGQYTYNDGSRYDGDYFAGKKHGVGRYTPALGESYMTRYEHGKLVESGEAAVFSGGNETLPHFTTLTRDFDHEQQEREGAEDRDEPVGVGIKFKALPDGGLEVLDVLAGGPADRDGRIAVGDRLFAIDGRNVYRAHIIDVLPLVRGSGGSSVKLDFDRDLGNDGSGNHMKFTVTLERHESRAIAPKSILSAMKPSKQLYHLPLDLKDADSDEDQKEPDVIQEQVIQTGREEADSKKKADIKTGMTMAEVCESVYRSRNPAADAQSGTLDIGKTLGTQDIIFGDEEEENDEDLSDEEEDEGTRADFDLDGPRAVHPEMVYIYMKSDEMNRMSRDPALRPLLEERLKKELVHELGCSLKIIEIFQMSPNVVPKGKVEDTEILGQPVQLPEQNFLWKPGEDYDKSALSMAIRVDLLVSIRGTADIIRPQKVSTWQREKAEWLTQSFDFHERFGRWNQHHYLQRTSKIELKGPWDTTRDRPVRHSDFSNLAERQMRSTEETRAIWSQRFMARYGNPVYLVVNNKERAKILAGTEKPITKATLSQTFTFPVRKRLNAFADGPRIFHLDLVQRALHNCLADTNLKKVGVKSELQKVLPFDMFKSVIPSMEKDTHMTIEFKPDRFGFRQRDYDFDFPTARDRKVFLLRLRSILDASCFGDKQDEDLATRDPNNFGNMSVMRRTVTAYTLSGKLPWQCDRYGNPLVDEEQESFKGRTPHPDAALASGDANASTCAVPPNAITPGLSNQQAAYVQSRPQVAESFYGHSVYRSAHRSSAISGGDSASVGRSLMGRSTTASARSARGRLSRSPSRYVGDRASSFRSGGKSPRSGRSSERGSKTTGAEDMTLKTLSVEHGSVRGQRLGEIEGVNFTNSDHVIAYKLARRIPEGKQLTPAQVQEAVIGQFAVLAVKKKVESLVTKQDAEAAQRKGIFYRKITRKGLHPSRELLNEVNREIIGLEECKNFRRMIEECRLSDQREVLCFPVAYPIQQRQPVDQVSEHAGQLQADKAISSRTSRISGSQHSDATAEDDLRHPVLGEIFLETRVPNGNLLHDSYLIQTRDTKQVLLNVQHTPQGAVVLGSVPWRGRFFCRD